MLDFSFNRGENQLIEDLSADLLTAVAPTPKSMYRTSGGYYNMAYSGRFNPENPVKSRRVWSDLGILASYVDSFMAPAWILLVNSNMKIA